MPFHALQCAYYLCDWVVSFFFCSMLLWCCLRRWDIIPNVYALNLPSANWSYLTFRQSIDCSFPASSSVDKKRLQNKQCSKFRGTRNLEHRCFCRRKNIRVDNFTNVFGWRRRTSSILNRSSGYRPTWDKKQKRSRKNMTMDNFTNIWRNRFCAVGSFSFCDLRGPIF